MYVVLRNGVEIPVDEELAIQFQRDLIENPKGFYKFNGQLINAADVTGIFNPETVENLTRHKNGQWKCKSNTWHEKSEKCSCPPLTEKEHLRIRAEAIANCGKCNKGYIYSDENSVRECDCIRYLAKS